jgi:hypothetical protein
VKMRKTRAAQINALESSKKRNKKRKLRRLKLAEARSRVVKALTPTKAHANVMAVKTGGYRTPEGDPAPGEVVFGVRTGLFGHPTTTVLRIQEERIAGAVEDASELGEVVTQLGLLTLGALLNFNLAEGPEELARAFARWAGIDLAQLRREAEEERKEQAEEEAREATAAGVTETVDEDGDIEVRTPYNELGGES